MEPPSRGTVTVLNESGRPLPTASVGHAVRVTLLLERFESPEVAVLLTSDEHVQQLNRTFRGVDAPTDVLTFVGDEPGSGDIAIAVPYAERQAALRGVPLEQELAYLAIHGALHLAGLDDEEEDERREMVDRMNVAAVAAGFLPDENWASILHGVSA